MKVKSLKTMSVLLLNEEHAINMSQSEESCDPPEDDEEWIIDEDRKGHDFPVLELHSWMKRPNFSDQDSFRRKNSKPKDARLIRWTTIGPGEIQD